MAVPSKERLWSDLYNQLRNTYTTKENTDNQLKVQSM